MEVLMVDEVLILMSYQMNSLGLFTSWGFLQRIFKPLVLIHFLACTLLGEHQSLSIPCEFSFLEYYTFVARRGVIIGLQGIHGPLTWMFHICWKIHMSYDHKSFPHVLFIRNIHGHGHGHILYLCILCHNSRAGWVE